MKCPLPILLLLALLCGYAASDAGKLFGKLAKAYKAHKEPGSEDVLSVESTRDELVAEEPEIMTTGEDDGRPDKMKMMMQQLLPKKEDGDDPHFAHRFTKVSPYGAGWYPTYGGMMYDENRMQEEMDAMREERSKFDHPRFVQ